MYSKDDTKKLSEQKRKLEQQIRNLCKMVDHDLENAFEIYFEHQLHLYFSIEEKLLGLRTLFVALDNQVKEATTCGELVQAANRISYVDDLLDEIESRLYRRRRRRQRFRFSDFFNRYRQQGSAGGSSENASLQEAYKRLGVSEGDDLFTVTTAFRRLAKEVHPDRRGGDRSRENDFRQIMAAYEQIKRHFATGL